MIQGTEHNITNRASLIGISCSFDKDNLRRFLQILQERLNAAAELEVSKFEQGDQTKIRHDPFVPDEVKGLGKPAYPDCPESGSFSSQCVDSYEPAIT
jgi:hypothetical protein